MDKISILRDKMQSLYFQNDLEAAIHVGDALLREHFHVDEHMSVSYANDLFNVAKIYDEAHQFERAVELYGESARQIIMLQDDNLAFANRLTAMAIAMSKMQMKEQAYLIHSQVAGITARVLGADDPLYADSLVNLAHASEDVGFLEDSLDFLYESLKIRERAGLFDPVIESLMCISYVYEKKDNNEQAIVYAQTAIDLMEDDEQNAALAGICNYLAGLFEKTDQPLKALTMYDDVLSIVFENVGNDHSVYLNVAYKRAGLLKQLGRTVDALKAYEDVKRVFETHADEHHIFYANCVRNMALIYKERGEAKTAIPLMERSIDIRKATADNITQDIVIVMELYFKVKDYESAVKTFMSAVEHYDAESPELTEMLHVFRTGLKMNDPEEMEKLLDTFEALGALDRFGQLMDEWAAARADQMGIHFNLGDAKIKPE